MNTATIEVQQKRFETLLLAGREDQILTEFLSAEFTKGAHEDHDLALVCVRALGVLVWRNPVRALSELAQWENLEHPGMEDLVLAIQANAYISDVWNRVCRAWSVPTALDNLVKYAHVVSQTAHADLLVAVGRDLNTQVVKYIRLFDWVVERGDLKVLSYIESLSFFGHSSPVDEVDVLAGNNGDLCEQLVRVAESATVYSRTRTYGMVALIAGATVALSYSLDLDMWMTVPLGLISGYVAHATGMVGKSKNAYYQDVVRPHLGRAYARHGCQDHELLVAWIRMNPRVSGLYPFYELYRCDQSLRLIGTMATGFRDASAWRSRD